MDCARDEAKRRPIATTVVGLRQVQDVENVEHFDPELRPYALGDRRVFNDREVDDFEARAKKLVALGIAEGSKNIYLERTGINPLHASLCPSRRLYNTSERIAQKVCAILLIAYMA